MKFKGHIELTEKSAKHLGVDINKIYAIDVFSKGKVMSDNNYVLISIPELGIEGQLQYNEINFSHDKISIRGWLSVSPESYLCQARFSLIPTHQESNWKS